MDSFYIDPSTQDSRQYRSRANSHLSSAAEHFSGLNIEQSEQGANIQDIPNFRTTSSPTYLEVSRSSPEDFIPAPIPQQCTPFPLLSESDLDPNWSYLTATEAPLLRLDPPHSFPEEHHSSSDYRPIRSNSNPGIMSTLGIQQYDARFDAGMFGGIRHTFTWPGALDIQDQQYVSQNPSPGQLTPNLYDEPKLIPMYARSISSSPPRANLTPEQRELKRQRDAQRRDSKTRVRRERSSSNQSNPYVLSQNGSPDVLPRTMPEYTSSLTPSPLLSQGSLQNSPALNNAPFLTPYTPQLNDQAGQDIYGPVFTMGPQDFSTPAYMPYAPTSSPNLQNFVGRPHSLSLSSVPSTTDHIHSSFLRQSQPSPKTLSSDINGDHVRVVHSRPKPQCWEHGCNGRQFSTFSNLLRHQREKSGASQKSSCPNCGAEFTRTTARNGHMAHDKCKSRRNS